MERLTIQLFDNTGKLVAELPVTDEVSHFYNEGVRLAYEGKMEKSINSFQQAITLEPRFTDAHYNLAVSYYALGRIEEAKTEYELVLDHRPQDVDALNNLGTIFAINGDLERAKELFTKALEFDEEFALTHRNLAAYYQTIGDTVKTEYHFHKAKELDNKVFDREPGPPKIKNPQRQESFLSLLTKNPKGTTALMSLANSADEAQLIVELIEDQNVEMLMNWFCTKEDRQEKLVAIASELDDASDLVMSLLSAGTTYVALKPEGQAQTAGFIDPGRIDPKERKNIRQNYELVFAKPIDPDGALHSNHLYLAARCVSVAKKVSPQLVTIIMDRFLIEFELEIAPPERAIRTIGEMGNIAIDPLMEFIKDSQRDTFSREDAALALGAVGSDNVIKSLGEWLDEVETEDAAMPLYALGITKNPKAIPIIQSWMQNKQTHPKMWVAQEALAKLKRS
ncbi:hypothetical protein A3A60_00350 [Candidatus Curtissbacteria bacterium RIFCSPLOWO2_01_FULL_42_26]|uniref:Uncharacterized protein n=1 Tax=Candidatus Curtissbacteria bacterium RIFCSPLOWO2_01_FULL_42_26 TaxID=1797729 RepID=A0A1F5HWB7_9BACT|nr:MAG: hypothetical protein A3A60_00350 [Candidatus Curtissbacteria bacterium RIFCSPLOWO2_01_FULL_42_26]